MLKRTLAAVTTLAAVSLPAAAQTEGGENVLATVNGEPITAADLTFAGDALGQSLAQVPEAGREEMLLNLLIDMNVLADAAEAAGIPDEDEFKERVEYARAQTLRDIYMARVVEEAVTDESVRARYDEEVAGLERPEEVNARHILVEDRATAEDLISQLDAGADFAELAREHSNDPGSGQRGGSLGFFGRGQMVPPFEEAAFALEPGTYTQEPVESQFGFHIIEVEEKRERPLPTFEEVGERIREIMVRETFVEEVERLKAEATIERMDTASADAVDPVTEPAAPETPDDPAAPAAPATPAEPGE